MKDNGKHEVSCIWLIGFTSPLTPLQPVIHWKAKSFLAGEGRKRERGLAPLLKISPFSYTLDYR